MRVLAEADLSTSALPRIQCRMTSSMASAKKHGLMVRDMCGAQVKCSPMSQHRMHSAN